MDDIHEQRQHYVHSNNHNIQSHTQYHASNHLGVHFETDRIDRTYLYPFKSQDQAQKSIQSLNLMSVSPRDVNSMNIGLNGRMIKEQSQSFNNYKSPTYLDGKSFS